MDEVILFRGQRTDTKKWVYGSYVFIKKGRPLVAGNEEHLIQTLKEDGSIGPIYDVIPETVGQFTGLPDKNGVKVFKGDLLKSKEFNDLLLVVYGEDEPCCYEMKSTTGMLYLLNSSTKIEVVGTIFDNPELFKIKENV